MNKNIFILLIITTILILLLSINFHNTQQNKLTQQVVFTTQFNQKVKKIIALQKFYNTKIDNLSKYCKIDNENSYIISCNNLTKKQFKIVEKLFFNIHNKIEKYNIKLNNNLITLKGTISK